MDNLQGTQIQLPVEMVKQLETLRSALNLDRGVVVQAVMETCFDNVVSEKGGRILEIQQERSLAKLASMKQAQETKSTKTETTKPESTKPESTKPETKETVKTPPTQKK